MLWFVFGDVDDVCDVFDVNVVCVCVMGGVFVVDGI